MTKTTDLPKLLKKLLDGKASKEEIQLLKQMFASGAISIGGNVSNSVIIRGNRNKVIQLTPEALKLLRARPSSKGIAVPSAKAIAQHRIALRKQLEENARARWGGMSVYIREEGAALPIEASPYGSLGKSEDLLETIKNTKRLLVLGEPGSGKSVSLERLAWDLCGEDQAAIPVLVPLRDYTEKLDEWVLSNFRQTDELKLQDNAQSAHRMSCGADCASRWIAYRWCRPSGTSRRFSIW